LFSIRKSVILADISVIFTRTSTTIAYFYILLNSSFTVIFTFDAI
jgi:hypothetical protein